MRRVDSMRVYRLLYPAVPAIVAATHRGRTSAMPVVSLISLSNEPPLLGLSSLPSHATFKAITQARCFSVSWLDRRYSEQVERLGTSSGRDVEDKLQASGLHHRTGERPLRVPRIVEASAYVDCELQEVRTYGDHRLVVGEIREAKAVEDFDEYWSFASYKPILYAGLGRRTDEK